MDKYRGQSSLVISWIILAAVMQAVMSQPMLTSSVGKVCPGNTILFTCTTTGSSTLTWSSEDYIGLGNQFQFLSIDNIGDSRSNSDAVATLTAINTGLPIILTSTLRIIPRPTTPNTSVSCTNAGGETSTLTIPLAAIPGAPQNVRAAEASERVDNNCIILVTWDPPTNIDVSDIDHYIVTVPSRNIVENGSSAIIALRIRNCHSNDSIQVATVNRFGCVGENSLRTPPRLLDDIARTTGSVANTPIGSTTSTPIRSTSASGSVIVVAVIAAVLFIIALVLSILLSVLLYIKKGGKKEAAGQQGQLQAIPSDKSEKHVDTETKLMDALQKDILVKRNLEELYNALKLKLPSRKMQAAARDLRATLMLGRESSKFKDNVKEAFITCLEALQVENDEVVQRATENLDNTLTGMTGIDEKFKQSVRRLRTKLGTGEHKEVLDDLIKKMEEDEPSTIMSILLSLCEKLRNVRQVKDYYCKQSKHDVSDLGTGEDRVSVPIWMDGALDDSWKDSLREAVKAINEAAPGLSLSITEDQKRAIIHVLAIDKKHSEPYTEVEGNMLMRLKEKNFVTKIHLGKWKDDGKKGICIHELLHALGFHHEHQDAIAAPYIYRLNSGKEITIEKNELGFIWWESSSTTLYPCEKKYREHSEGHVCKWVLEAYPTKVNTDLDEHDMVGLNLVYPPCVDKTANNAGYRPKLGKNGMYYCGREVMIGLTFPGGEYTRSCGPSNGPNCSACRTIKSPRVEEILAGGRWQGMTGRVYCGRPFTEPGKLSKVHDGMCGMDDGPACPDCNKILNNEYVQPAKYARASV